MIELKTLQSISPGYTNTEMLSKPPELEYETLEATDVSAAVLYTLGTPPNVQVRID